MSYGFLELAQGDDFFFCLEQIRAFPRGAPRILCSMGVCISAERPSSALAEKNAASPFRRQCLDLV